MSDRSYRTVGASELFIVAERAHEQHDAGDESDNDPEAADDRGDAGKANDDPHEQAETDRFFQLLITHPTTVPSGTRSGNRANDLSRPVDFRHRRRTPADGADQLADGALHVLFAGERINRPGDDHTIARFGPPMPAVAVSKPILEAHQDLRPFEPLPFFDFPATRIAIATACLRGLPAAISVRMFADIALSLEPFFSGTGPASPIVVAVSVDQRGLWTAHRVCTVTKRLLMRTKKGLTRTAREGQSDTTTAGPPSRETGCK